MLKAGARDRLIERAVLSERRQRSCYPMKDSRRSISAAASTQFGQWYSPGDLAAHAPEFQVQRNRQLKGTVVTSISAAGRITGGRSRRYAFIAATLSIGGFN
jgi:hypothetical protein